MERLDPLCFEPTVNLACPSSAEPAGPVASGIVVPALRLGPLVGRFMEQGRDTRPPSHSTETLA